MRIVARIGQWLGSHVLGAERLNAVRDPTYSTDAEGRFHLQPSIEDEILAPLVEERRQQEGRDSGSR